MELMTTGVQTVEPNQSITFQTAITAGSASILWRIGSALVTLRGIGPQLRSRFRVSTSMNVALPTGTADTEVISVAISIDGEPLNSATMISTPAAAEEYNNIACASHIDVARGCCVSVSLQNISSVPITVQNCNLIVERVA